MEIRPQTLGFLERWPSNVRVYWKMASNVRVYGKLGLILEGFWESNLPLNSPFVPTYVVVHRS